MSKSSFYHYVASKEQLFERVLWAYGPALIEILELPSEEELARDFWGELDGIVDRLAAGRDARPRLRADRSNVLPPPVRRQVRNRTRTRLCEGAGLVASSAPGGPPSARRTRRLAR